MSFLKTKIRTHYIINPTEILEWFCVLLLILLSGCVYFTQAHRIETSFALVICTVLYCWRKKAGLKEKSFRMCIFIVAVLVISYLANAKTMTIANVADYALIMVVVTCLTFISSAMPLETFQDKYVKIMCVICIISLICYYIQLTDYAMVNRLGSINIVDNYIVSWYHTWGWTYIFERNAGPFWEPGAFQGFLLIGILFILNTKKIREHYIALGLLALGVGSTLSTTGYVLLSLISVYLIIVYWRASIKTSGVKITVLIQIIAVIAIVVLLIKYIIDSNVITNKISSENESFSIRLLHLRNGLRVALQRPLFGYGISSSSLREALGNIGMNSNSIGIFSILQYYGVFLGFIFIILNFIATNKVYNNLNTIVVIAIFVILHLTEALLLFPVYMSFLFFRYSRSEQVYYVAL